MQPDTSAFDSSLPAAPSEQVVLAQPTDAMVAHHPEAKYFHAR